MRVALAMILMVARLAFAQIPEQGRFEYVLYDNQDRPVGSYFFTIRREGDLWRIASEMSVDTRFFLLPIRLNDRNTFTHDGKSFQSFSVEYFKDVPLQKTLRVEVLGSRSEKGWTIRSSSDRETFSRDLPHESFEEVRNLISRLVRPQAVLHPGESRRARSLDPVTLEISDVESRGVEIESVEFQGRRRELFVMEIKAPDGDVRVKKFANGLIYRSQTAEGYALLKSANMPSF